MNRLLLLPALLLPLLVGASAPSATLTWSGAALDGDWSNVANWGGLGPPGAADTVIFDATGAPNPPPTANSPAALTSIEVQASYTQAPPIVLNQNLSISGDLILDTTGGASLSLNGFEVSVGGNCSVTGTGLVPNPPGTPSVNFTGTGAWSGPGVATFGQVRITNAGMVTLTSNAVTTGTPGLDISEGELVLSAGTVLTVAGDLDLGSAVMDGILDAQAGAQIDVTGDYTVSFGGGGTIIQNPTNLTTRFNGVGVQSLSPLAGMALGNLVVAGSTVRVASQDVLANSLVISSGTLDLEFNNRDLTVTGDVDLSGGTLEMDPARTLALGGGSPITVDPGPNVIEANLTIAGTAPVQVRSNALVVGTPATPATTFVSGTLDLNTDTTFNGAVTVSGTFQALGDPITIQFDEDDIGNPVILNASGTINIDGAGANTIILESTLLGDQWALNLNPGATQVFIDVMVRDSDANPGVTAVATGSSVNLGNNLNWSGLSVPTATWVGSGGINAGVWGAPVNWLGGIVPGPGTLVIFDAVGNAFPPPTLNSFAFPVLGGIEVRAAYTAGTIAINSSMTLSRDLVLDAGSTISLNLNLNTLFVRGDATVGRNIDNGTVFFDDPGTSTLTMTGGLFNSSTLTVGSGGPATTVLLANSNPLTVSNLSVNAASTFDAASTGAPIVVTTQTFIGGTLRLGSSALDATGLISGAGTLDASGGGNINAAGGLTVATYSKGAGTLTFDGTGDWSGASDFGTVVVNGSGIAVTALSSLLMDSLTISDGTFNENGQNLIDINGLLAIGDGAGVFGSALFRQDGNTTTVEGGIDVSAVDGRYFRTTGTLTFDGSGTWTGTIDSFGTVVVDGVGTTVMSGSNLQTTTLTVNNGTLEVSAGHTLDVDGLLSGTGTLDASGGGNVNVEGGLTIGAYTKGAGTLTFDGAGDWSGAGDFGTVTVNLAGSVTLQSTVLCESLLVSGGTLDLAANTLTLGGTSANPLILGGGTLNAASGTVRYATLNGGGNVNVTPFSYGVLEISQAAETFDLTGNTFVTGIVLTNGTLDLNGQALTIGGTLPTPVTGAGAFNASTGVVEYATNNGGAGVAVRATSYASLTINQPGETFTLPGATSVSQLLLNTGTLDVNGQTLTIGGTLATPITGGGTLDATPGTVIYTTLNGGGNVNVRAQTYENLTINSAGETFSLTGNTSASQVTLTAGTMEVNGQTLTIGGTMPTPITGAGFLDADPGTVEYTTLALGNVNVFPATYGNLLFNQVAETFQLTGPTAITTLNVTAGTLATGTQNMTVTGNATITGSLNVGGGFTDVNGTFGGTGSVVQNGGTLSLAGATHDFRSLATFSAAAGTTILDRGAAVLLDVDGAVTFFNLTTTAGTDVTLAPTSTAGLDVDGNLSLGGNLTLDVGAASVANGLTVSAVLDLNGQNLTVTGVTEVDGTLSAATGTPIVDLDGGFRPGSTGTLVIDDATLRLSGVTNDFSDLGAFTFAAGGTLDFDGSATQSFTPRAGSTLQNVTLNKSAAGRAVQIVGPTTIVGTTMLTTGTLDLQSDTTFQGAVTTQATGRLSATTSAITLTFQNGLTIIGGGGQATFAASGLDIVFFEGTTLNVGGTLTVTGNPGPANFVTLRDQDPLGAGDGPGGGLDWFVTPTGTVNVTRAQIQDSDATPGATAVDSIDAGGNTNWTFPTKTTNWTGGGADDNWSTSANWDNGPPNPGDDVAMPAGAGNSTVDQNFSVASLDINGFTGSLSLSSVDLDVTGAVNVSTGTFSLASGRLTSSSLTIDSTVNGGSGIGGVSIDTGNFTLNSGATFGQGTGELTISGNATFNSASTFAGNPVGTVVFDGGGAQTWDGGSVNLGSVLFRTPGTSVQLINSDAVVTALTISPLTTLDLNNRTLTASVGVTVGGALQDTTGAGPGIALDTADLTVQPGGFFIESAKDTFVSGNLSTTGTWTENPAGTLTFDGTAIQEWTGTGVNFGGVIVDNGGAPGTTVRLVNTAVSVTTLDVTADDTLDLNANALIIEGDGVSPSALTVGGTYVGAGDTTFRHTAPADSIIPVAGATYQNVILEGATTYAPENDLALSGDLGVTASSALTLTDGASEFDLTVGGDLFLDGTVLAGTNGPSTISISGILNVLGTLGLNNGNPVTVNLAGDLSVTATATLSAAEGTFNLNGLAAQSFSIQSATAIALDVNITNLAGVTLGTDPSFTVAGDVSVSGAALIGGGFTLLGDYDATGGLTTWVGGSTLLTLAGAGQTLTLDTNSSAFANILVDQAAAMDVVAVNGVGPQTFTTGTLTVTQGILDLNLNSQFGGSATTIGAGGTIRNDDAPGLLHEFFGDDGVNSLLVNGGAFLFTTNALDLVLLEGRTAGVGAGSTFTVSGSAGQQNILRDETDNAAQWSLDVDAAAIFTLHQAAIQDLNGTGSASPLTATNSTDNGDNTGLTFVMGGIVVTPTTGLITTELNSGTDTFTIVLTSAPTSNVTIGLSSSNPQEGGVSPGSVTFTPGDWFTAQVVTVTGADDVLADGDTPYLILTDPAVSADLAYSGLDSTDVGVLNLDDETAGTLQFSVAAYSVAESGTTATITVTRAIGKLGSVSVNYATSDGTATAGSDYSSASGIVTFADQDATDKTFTIPIVLDALLEGDETVNLTLSGPTGGATLGAPATAVLTIMDGAGSIQLSASNYSVAENGATFDVTVTRMGGSGGAVTVDLDTSDATASQTADYNPVSALVSFADGDAADKTVTITILDDALVEGDETVNLILSNPTGGASLGGPSTGTLTIVDHEAGAGTVQFVSAAVSAVENQGTLSVDVIRVNGTAGTLQCDIDSLSGSAAAGADYTAVAALVTFLDGEVTQTVQIPILDDALVETDETFTLTLSNVVGGALGAPATATVTIVDHEVVAEGTLQFSALDYQVTENGGTALITVVRTGGSGGGVTVDFSTSDVTANAGADYAATAGTLAFADGQISASFVVPILDDAAVEGDEILDLALSNPTGGAALGAFDMALLTITDYEPGQPGEAQFTGPITVSEDAGHAIVTVQRINGSAGTVAVDVATGNLTAVAPLDFTAVSLTLTFGDRETLKVFLVPLVDDAQIEGSETLNLTLSNATGGVVIVGINPELLTILDDESVGRRRSRSKCGATGWEGPILLSLLGLLGFRRRR